MKVRIIHELSKQERVGEFKCFDIDSPTVVLFFGTLIGRREFSYNSGYGKALATSKEAPIREWRINEGDLAKLREMARAQGKKISPCGKSPGRPRQPKRGKPPHPKQMAFGDIE